MPISTQDHRISWIRVSHGKIMLSKRHVEAIDAFK